MWKNFTGKGNFASLKIFIMFKISLLLFGTIISFQKNEKL
jgi:hypothetical protein